MSQSGIWVLALNHLYEHKDFKLLKDSDLKYECEFCSSEDYREMLPNYKKLVIATSCSSPLPLSWFNSGSESPLKLFDWLHQGDSNWSNIYEYEC